MSWLIFMDESGHDHKLSPLEVRGGVALRADRIWNFIQDWRRLERECFGRAVSDYDKEIKGMSLLDKKRFRFARQLPWMSADERRKGAIRFLDKGRSGERPTVAEFTAYGQASLEMARGIFDVLQSHEARLFACVIPRGAKPPKDFQLTDFLRKDHVFLLERIYHFLEAEDETGLIVMDQSEVKLDCKFLRQIENYFAKTGPGRNWAARIVPTPLFVASDMVPAVQAADVALYCLNWGFRLSFWGQHDVREEIAAEFGPKINRLQWAGEVSGTDGKKHRSYGIRFVPDPYTSRRQNKEGGNAHRADP